MADRFEGVIERSLDDVHSYRNRIFGLVIEAYEKHDKGLFNYASRTFENSSDIMEGLERTLEERYPEATTVAKLMGDVKLSWVIVLIILRFLFPITKK